MPKPHTPKPASSRPCNTPDELHTWLTQHLSLTIPRQPVCPNHVAPFDYLCSAYFEPARDLVVWAPRGGGKTRLGAAATLLDLLHKPPCQVRILGGSLEQSLRMWEHLWPDVERLAADQLAGRSRTRRLTLDSGSSAAVLTQSQRAVRGLHVQKLRCDEVELFDPDVWEAAQLATRSTRSKGWSAPITGAVEAISTLHAPLGLMHRIIDRAGAAGIRILRWCLLEVLEKCPADRSCADCLLADDCRGVAHTRCAGFIPIDDAIAMKRRVSRETWESEMLCLRPSRRDQVFAHFDSERHIRSADPANPGQMWLGIDFGYAAPFVCLFIWAGEDGTHFVVDEYHQEQRMVHEHLDQIRARRWPAARNVACDPAGAGRNDQTATSNVALLRSAGYRVHHRSSLIVDGLEKIRALLAPAAGPPRLFIHPRCRRLLAAMQSYRYAPGGSELPIKDGTHDHLIDALRYYLINQSPAPGLKVRCY